MASSYLVLLLGFPHWHNLSISANFLVVALRDLGFHIELLEHFLVAASSRAESRLPAVTWKSKGVDILEQDGVKFQQLVYS